MYAISPRVIIIGLLGALRGKRLSSSSLKEKKTYLLF